MKYTHLDEDYAMNRSRPGDRSVGTPSNTQKQVKLKQLRLKNKPQQDRASFMNYRRG